MFVKIEISNGRNNPPNVVFKEQVELEGLPNYHNNHRYVMKIAHVNVDTNQRTETFHSILPTLYVLERTRKDRFIAVPLERGNIESYMAGKIYDRVRETRETYGLFEDPNENKTNSK